MDHTPHNSTETKPSNTLLNTLETHGRRIGASLLIAFGAVTLSACSSEQVPAEPTAATEIAEPSPSATSKPTVSSTPEAPSVDFTKLPEDVVEYNLFETLTEDQQAEILTMKNMSVEEFRELPKEQQLKFSYFVYDNNIDFLKYRLDATNQSQIYKGVNFDTALGMQRNGDVKFALLASLKTQNPDTGIAFDKETALKTSSYLVPEGNAIRQTNLDAEINTWNLNTAAILRPVQILASATLPNGDIISNEFASNTKEEYQNVYRVVDVPLINGETRKDGVTVSSIDPTDPRYVADINSQVTQ
jgi:hypothetical protein